MKYFHKTKWIRLILVSLLLSFSTMLLLDCSSSNKHRRKGKLSDAMAKASDENKGDRKTETTYDPQTDNDYSEENENEDYIDIVTSIVAESMEAQPVLSDSIEEAGNVSNIPGQSLTSSQNWSDGSPWLSFVAGTGLLKQNDYYGLNHFTARFGGYGSNRFYVALSGGLGWAPIHYTSALRASLKKNVVLLNIGLLLKCYTTPRHTFLGHYFLFGLNYNHLFWEYKNPISVDIYNESGEVVDTQTLRADDLSGIEFYGGLGFNLVQTRAFQFGAEVSPGIIFWWVETTSGFENDIFDPFLYIKFSIVANFKLKR